MGIGERGTRTFFRLRHSNTIINIARNVVRLWREIFVCNYKAVHFYKYYKRLPPCYRNKVPFPGHFYLVPPKFNGYNTQGSLERKANQAETDTHDGHILQQGQCVISPRPSPTDVW